MSFDLGRVGEVVSTAESIAVHIRNLLPEQIREIGAELFKVKLVEIPNNSCEVYGTQLEKTSVNRKLNEEVLVRF